MAHDGVHDGDEVAEGLSRAGAARYDEAFPGAGFFDGLYLVLVEPVGIALGRTEDLGRLGVKRAPRGQLLHRSVPLVGRGELHQGLRPKVFLLAQGLVHELPCSFVSDQDEGVDEVLVILEGRPMELEDTHPRNTSITSFSRDLLGPNVEPGSPGCLPELAVEGGHDHWLTQELLPYERCGEMGRVVGPQVTFPG